MARPHAVLVFFEAVSSYVLLLTDDGAVSTVTGNGFFDWGLVDGPAHEARLQRPGGVTMHHDGSVIIADTGNNRVRRLANRRLQTLGLSGLERPSGLASLDSGHLIIADTGHNRLVVIDPDLRSAWTLAIAPIG